MGRFGADGIEQDVELSRLAGSCGDVIHHKCEGGHKVPNLYTETAVHVLTRILQAIRATAHLKYI